MNRVISLVALLVPSLVSGQVLCRVRPGTRFNDGGWSGPNSNLECDFPQGDLQLFCELRPLAGSYGGPGSFAGILPEGSMSSIPLQHLAVYALRGSGVFPDSGVATARSPEWTITADTVAPTLLGVPGVDELDGGTFHVSWAPSTDDGEGQVAYETSFRLVNENRPGSEDGPTGVAVPELRADLGPGTWAISVQVVDVVRNYGGRQTSEPFVIEADPTVAPPSPPEPRAAIFNNTSISFNVFEPADGYHFIGVEQDGGVFAGPVNRLVPGGPPLPVAYGYLPRECSFRVRASRLVGGRASQWSSPSPEFKVDLSPPTAPADVRVTSDGGTLELSWVASTDTCSGVKHYLVERSDGSAWLPLGPPVQGTQVEDSPPDSGLWRYRVRAVDHADHQSGFAASPDQPWPPGSLGGSGGGARAAARYAVGCGCNGGSTPALLLTLALTLRRIMQRPSPRSPHSRSELAARSTRSRCRRSLGVERRPDR